MEQKFLLLYLSRDRRINNTRHFMVVSYIGSTPSADKGMIVDIHTCMAKKHLAGESCDICGIDLFLLST